MKRITEVSLVSIMETRPDISLIGEYTDKPSDWVIVCQEGDYLYNLNFQADKQAYELPGHGRKCRFFKPYAGGEEEGTADYQTYGLQDYKRAEAYNRGDWCMLGLKAIAKIQTRPGANSNWLCNEVSSSGLWGIESDCGDEYKKEVFDGQLAELRDALKAFGFNNRQIDQAFEKAVEKDGGYDC